jgi:hypothetical protein
VEGFEYKNPKFKIMLSGGGGEREEGKENPHE